MMQHHPFRLPAQAILAAAIGVPLMPAQDPAPDRRPSIVIVMSDDMGYSDIGCYGGEIHTPRLDALADNGIRFTQFYNGARCCPTRAALLTGLYAHQAGVGHMLSETGKPGYTDGLNDSCLTIAELLRPAGYRTYMSGKWHVTRFTAANGPKDDWPLQRGFDRFYGTVTGAGNFYDPTTLCRGNTFITPENDPDYRPGTFYYTDAISDNAVAFVRRHGEESPDRPLFLYVAYTAAHWPMHALADDVARYRGAYDDGYDAVRRRRVERLLELGLIDPGWTLTDTVGAWSDVPAERREWELRGMEVYAAMVESMDRGIGRIVDALDAIDHLDDTLFLFLQDNGGCAEGMGRRRPTKPYPDYQPMAPAELQKQIWPPMQTRDGRPVRVGPDVLPGPADTYISYGRNWANVSNTPFREYKHWVHEGGIATPLIVHWPAGLPAARRGALERQPGHIIDLMATCVAVSGADYPIERGGQPITPLQGVSLLPAFRGEPQAPERTLYWEHEANCAIRDGRWKLVRKGSMRDGKLRPWELYDMVTDRTEMHDLAAEQPDRVAALAARWKAWAERSAVLPWPWKRDR